MIPIPWTPLPDVDDPYPTLGWYVLDFMHEFLAAPEAEDYCPFDPTEEQSEFVRRLYELDPITGQRIVRRAGLSRPRGWG